MGGAAPRRAGTAALLLIAGVLLTLLGAGSAQASGYRYWSFWEGEGTAWTYATQGPSLTRPDDGAVQGFRFSVSENSQDASQPRSAPAFTEICARTPAKDGTKRVALVIDPGTAADAPDGESAPALRTACARVAPDASTAEALASVAKPLRYGSNALLCAISGYPESGCGEQVSGNDDGGGDGDAAAGPAGASEPATGATASDSASVPAAASASASASGDGSGSGGPSAGVLVGVGAVLLLGIAAVLQARRRR